MRTSVSEKMTTPRKRKPNVFDVARLAGVSQTTVSFVLNGSTSAKISEATGRRVKDAVEKLGYRPNALARSLAHGKTMTVGMVVPYFGDFHSEIVLEVQRTLRERGYQLLFGHANSEHGDEVRSVQFLLQHSVDAIICFAHSYSTGLFREWLADIERAAVPAVFIDSRRFDGNVDTVASDDIDGIDQIVQHLYDLGHRHICLVGSQWPDDCIPDRVLGFDLSRRRLGLDYDVQIGTDRCMSGEEYARDMVNLLESSEAPTAFVTYNDYVYERFIMEQAGGRWRVPADVSLAGYGDTYLAKLARLTTVCQQPRMMGRAAAERLLERLEDPDSLPRHTVVDTKLIVRDSTAPPRSIIRSGQ